MRKVIITMRGIAFGTRRRVLFMLGQSYRMGPTFGPL